MTNQVDVLNSSREVRANLRDEKFKENVSLPYLFTNFLKIGSTAFGGFMALVSVIENIIVERRKLLTHEDMLDGISLASILPGPVACLLYTSPSPRDLSTSRMPSSA